MGVFRYENKQNSLQQSIQQCTSNSSSRVCIEFNHKAISDYYYLCVCVVLLVLLFNFFYFLFLPFSLYFFADEQNRMDICTCTRAMYSHAKCVFTFQPQIDFVHFFHSLPLSVQKCSANSQWNGIHTFDLPQITPPPCSGPIG